MYLFELMKLINENRYLDLLLDTYYYSNTSRYLYYSSVYSVYTSVAKNMYKVYVVGLSIYR